MSPRGRSAGDSSPNCTGVGGSSGSLLACLIELLEESGRGTNVGLMKDGLMSFAGEGDRSSLRGGWLADGCLEVRGDLTEVEGRGLFSVKVRIIAAEKPSCSEAIVIGA